MNAPTGILWQSWPTQRLAEQGALQRLTIALNAPPPAPAPPTPSKVWWALIQPFTWRRCLGLVLAIGYAGVLRVDIATGLIA